MQIDNLDVDIDENFDPLVQVTFENEMNNFFMEQLEKELTGNFWALEEEADTLYGVRFQKKKNCFMTDPVWKESIDVIDQLTSEDPESLQDFNEPDLLQSDAQQWFEDDCDTPETPANILEIIKACLKGVKKIHTPRAFKAVTQLTAVIQYVKLRERYRKHPRCTKPCLNASLAIARRVGKDQYHARQIRANERYLIKYGRLPPSKREQQHGQYTLLDNQAILLGVRRYLAAQGLGTITPRELCRHVNEAICPALGLTGKNAVISERTAINWLHKLGYSYTEVRKGLYFDGHERPDVVEARVKFLGKMKDYERYLSFLDFC